MKKRLLNVQSTDFAILVLSLMIQVFPVNGASSYVNPWTNRFTGQTLLGSGQFSGFVDGMIPVFGNAHHLFFADGSRMAGRDDNLSASAGLGIRQLHQFSQEQAIFGAFVFADY